jgi:GNAT superfamily N-acetyltransferase
MLNVSCVADDTAHQSGTAYAVIESVVVEKSVRGTGLGKQIMAATLQAAWDAGCYKPRFSPARAGARPTPSIEHAASIQTSRPPTSLGPSNLDRILSAARLIL